MLKKNFFFNKTILIYGFGLSGKSTFEFLKKNNTCIIYDDNKKKISKKYNNFSIKKTKLNKVKFNYIIISPGINIEKCELKNFIKKNYSKIITELDIFQFCYPSIKKVAITGTNGKSTTSKIIHEACLESKIDATHAFQLAPKLPSKQGTFQWIKEPKSLILVLRSSLCQPSNQWM